MAFLEQVETSGRTAIPTIIAPGAPGDFTPLEWSVIRIARGDRLWTIRRAGPTRRFWMWLIGRGNPQLANERLEALRQMAVLSWHFGFTVHGNRVAEFLSAGFTSVQYEVLVFSVGNDLRRRPAPGSREDLA